MTEVSIISEQSGFFVFFKSAGLSSSRRPKEVEFFTCKDVTLVDLLLKSFIFSFISREVWTQGNDSNMPSLLKIMFKIMFLYRILTHFADEVSQLVVDCVKFSSRLCLCCCPLDLNRSGPFAILKKTASLHVHVLQ